MSNQAVATETTITLRPVSDDRPWVDGKGRDFRYVRAARMYRCLETGEMHAVTYVNMGIDVKAVVASNPATRDEINRSVAAWV